MVILVSSPLDGLSLRDGSSIGIIGGGPAGCFFAHFAQQEARKRGISLEITLYDGKTFARSGPLGCNMCAGVVATTLVQKLQEMGFALPENVVQRHITGYYLETPAASIALTPPSDAGPIYTVYRGNGPRGYTSDGNISFDDYLLEQVRKQGVTIINEPVLEIHLPESPERGKVTVVSRSGIARDFHLVVGAFGIHGPLAKQVASLNFGYRPPPSMPSYQAELYLGEEAVSRHLGNAIHIYALNLPGIQFAALTPKKAHVTVTLVGAKAGPEALTAFLAHPAVRRRLPSQWRLPADHCHCRPRVPVGPCRHPFTDRLVIVGDASNSRLYKNGLESAFITGRAAAQTAIRYGVARAAWERHYYPVCRSIARDSFYGHIIFAINNLIMPSHRLSRILLTAVVREQQAYPLPQRLLNGILWNTFTGDRPYGTILRVALSPQALARILRLGMGTAF